MGTSAVAAASFVQPWLRLAGTPVLTYHGLASPDKIGAGRLGNRFWVSRLQFENQLSEIRRAGVAIKLLRTLRPSDSTREDNRPAVVLTFDDGRVSDYEVAFPVLAQAQARAEFFLNTANVGKPGFLNWQQVNEMRRAGMSFQSHGHHHVDLCSLPLSELARQLRDSKRILEEHLQCSVDFLAVPYGQFNSRLISEARATGYRAVCTSRCWPARPAADSINRVPIYGYTNIFEFRGLLACSPLSYGKRAIPYAMKYVPKHLLMRVWPEKVATWRIQHE